MPADLLTHVAADPAAQPWPKPCSGVCILVTDFDAPTGGVQMQTRRLATELSRRGMRVFILARNYHGLARVDRDGDLLVHRSPVFGRVRVLNSLIYLADSVWWMVRNRRSFDVIHCQQLSGPAVAGLIAKKLIGKPVVVRLSSTGTLGEVRFVQTTRFGSLRQRQLRTVDHWVALTPAMRDEIVALGVSPRNIAVIPNSAVLPLSPAYVAGVRSQMRASLGLDYEQVGVFAGRLSEEKRIDLLLRAWRGVLEQFPHAHLLLLGQGGEYRNVERQLRCLQRELQLENHVHFVGHVANVGDYLLASDVFCLPTTTEGMSNSLVEAMAAGAAIVTTRIPANIDLLEDQRSALLVSPGTVNEFTKAILGVLSSPDLRDRLGEAARNAAERNLTVERMGARYLDLYRHSLGA